jgi:SAM-dependent methyltransferase
VLAAAIAWCRAEARLRRGIGPRPVLDSVRRLSDAALSAALSREEKSLLTLGIYDASPIYAALADELFAIEQSLFARELPQPPARVLVGGCGAGREAIVLTALGHRVAAFDPAPAFVAESRRRLPMAVPVVQLSYEGLSAAVLDAEVPAGLARERFDAVVLGCGSLSHVLDPGEQRRLFQALVQLCPSGPIIGSFLWTPDDAVAAQLVGRAARWGRHIGRALGRLRGYADDASPHLSYQAERGFAYTFTQREIEQLARGIGRRVVWEPDGQRASLYASFLAPRPSMSQPAQ